MRPIRDSVLSKATLLIGVATSAVGATVGLLKRAEGKLRFQIDELETWSLHASAKLNTNLATLIVLFAFVLLGEIAYLMVKVDHQTALLAQVWAFSQLESPADGGNRRLDTRRFMIRSQLAQADHPIVIMGDSITEGALLPTSVCGRPVVNAGIGGMTAVGYLSQLQQFTTHQDIALAVLALGTNDASSVLAPNRDFAASYVALANFVAKDAAKTIFVGLPPIDPERGWAKNYFSSGSATQINATIQKLARDHGIGFVNLRSDVITADLTVDGVHLNKAGYQLWSSAILSAIRSAIGCPETSAP